MARRKAEFDIKANDKATATLRRVSGETGKLNTGLTKLKAVAGAALGALATGAAVRGLVRMTQAGLESVDSLAKQADRLGIATQSLQAYRNASELAGVSQESLEKGLGRLNKNIGDVKNGLISASSPVAKAFDQLGVTLADIESQSPEEVFETLVDRLGKIDDTATQGALAMQLFGRSGQQMITLFNGGLAGIDESRKLLDELGLSVDRLDAGKVEAANDAFTRLEQVTSAAKQRFAVELAPAIEAVFTRLLETGKEGENFGERIRSGVGGAVEAFTRFGSAVSLVGNSASAAFNLIQGAASGLAGGVLEFAAVFVDAIGTKAPNALNSLLAATEEGTTKMKQGFADFATTAANVIIAGMNKGIGAVDLLVNSAAAQLSNFLALANKIPGVDVGSFSYSQQSEKAQPFQRFPVERSDFGRVGTFGGDTSANLRDISGDYLKAANEQLLKAGGNIRSAVLAADDLFSSDGSELNRAFKEATQYSKELTQAIDGSGGTDAAASGGGGGAAGAMRKLGAAAVEVGQEIANGLTTAQQAGQSLTNNLGSAIDEFTRTGKLKFSDFARSVLADLAAIQLKSALLGSDGSGGIIGSVISGLFGGAGGASPSYAGGGYTGSGARSGGVDGKGGFPAILHPDETVIDHSAGQMGGGGGVVINQTIEVRETLPHAMAREIVKQAQAGAMAAFAQIKPRGGQRARAFGVSG